jgi:hypothetical protein
LLIVNLENLDLGLVIQEIRVFSETPLKSKKCELVLMKLLYLIYNGTKLSESDATTVFFAITKTFQSKEVLLFLFYFILFYFIFITAIFTTSYVSCHKRVVKNSSRRLDCNQQPHPRYGRKRRIFFPNWICPCIRVYNRCIILCFFLCLIILVVYACIFREIL